MSGVYSNYGAPPNNRVKSLPSHISTPREFGSATLPQPLMDSIVDETTTLGHALDDDRYLDNTDDDDDHEPIGPLKIVGREADPFDKEAWDDDFDFQVDEEDDNVPTNQFDSKVVHNKKKSRVFHALECTRAAAKAHGPPSLMATKSHSVNQAMERPSIVSSKGPEERVGGTTDSIGDGDIDSDLDFSDFEMLNTHITNDKRSGGVDSLGDSNDDYHLSIKLHGADDLDSGFDDNDDDDDDDFEDWDAEIEAELNLTSPTHESNRSDVHGTNTEQKARMRSILESDLDDEGSDNDADDKLSKDKRSFARNTIPKNRHHIRPDHTLLSNFNTRDHSSQNVAIVMYPAPPALYSLHTLDGFKAMTEKQVDEWLTNLIRKRIPLRTTKDILSALVIQHPYNGPDTPQANQLDFVVYLQYTLKWCWLYYKERLYQHLWDTINTLMLYIQANLHTDRVKVIKDDPDCYLLLHNIMLLASKIWNFNIANTFCSLIVFLKIKVFPKYSRFFELLELETIAHHDGTQANTIIRRLCLIYCRVAPAIANYTLPPSGNVLPLTSKNGNLRLITSIAQLYKPTHNNTVNTGSGNTNTNAPTTGGTTTNTTTGTSSIHMATPSVHTGGLSGSSHSSDRSGNYASLAGISTDPDAIAMEVALRAITGLQYYLTSSSPLNASALNPDAEWDEEAPEYEWMRWAWNGDVPSGETSPYHKYNEQGEPIIPDLKQITGVTEQLHAIEHFVWRVCGHPEYRIRLIYNLYSKTSLGWAKCMAANALARHEWFIDDDKVPEEHVRTAERLLMEGLLMLDLLPSMPKPTLITEPLPKWAKIDVCISPLLGELALNSLQLFSDVMFTLNKYKYAICSLEAALVSHEHRCGESHSLIRALSDVCVNHNDDSRAMLYQLKILSQAIVDGNLDSYVFVVQEASKLCAKQGNYQRAEELVRKALAFLLALSSPSSQSLAQALIEARHARGNPTSPTDRKNTVSRKRSQVTNTTNVFVYHKNSPDQSMANLPLSPRMIPVPTPPTAIALAALNSKIRVEVKGVSLTHANQANLATQLPTSVLEGGLSRLLSVAVADIKVSIANLIILLAQLYISGDKLAHALVLLESMRVKDQDVRLMGSTPPPIANFTRDTLVHNLLTCLKSPYCFITSPPTTQLPGATHTSSVNSSTSNTHPTSNYAGLVLINSSTPLTNVVTPWLVLSNIAASLPKARITQIYMLLSQVYMKLSLGKLADRMLRQLEITSQTTKDTNDGNNSQFNSLVTPVAENGYTIARDFIFSHEYLETRSNNCVLLGDFRGALNWINSAIRGCEQSSLHLLGRLYFRKATIYQYVLLDQLRKGPAYAEMKSQIDDNVHNTKVKHSQHNTNGNTNGTGMHGNTIRSSTYGNNFMHNTPGLYEGDIPAHVPFKSVGTGDETLLLPDPRNCASAFTSAYNHFEKVDDKYRMALCLSNLAEIYLHVVFTAICVAKHTTLDLLPWFKLTGFCNENDPNTSAVADKSLAHFLDVVENFCSTAIKTASEAFLPLLLLQCQLNLSEIRVLQGHTHAALSYWLETRNSYQAAFVIHDQVLLPPHPTRSVLDSHYNIITRLIRLLFTFDTVYINANLILLDTFMNFQNAYTNQNISIAMNDYIEDVRCGMDENNNLNTSSIAKTNTNVDLSVITGGYIQSQLHTMGNLGSHSLSPYLLSLLADQKTNPNGEDGVSGSSGQGNFHSCERCRCAMNTTQFKCPPNTLTSLPTAGNSLSNPVFVPLPPPPPSSSTTTTTTNHHHHSGHGNNNNNMHQDANPNVIHTQSSSTTNTFTPVMQHTGTSTTLLPPANVSIDVPSDQDYVTQRKAQLSTVSRRGYLTADAALLSSHVNTPVNASQHHHNAHQQQPQAVHTKQVYNTISSGMNGRTSLNSSSSGHNNIPPPQPLPTHLKQGKTPASNSVFRSRCGAGLLEDLDMAILALEEAGGGCGIASSSSSSSNSEPGKDLELAMVANEMDRVRYLHLLQASDLYKGVSVTTAHLNASAPLHSQLQIIRGYNNALTLVGSAGSVLSLPLAYTSHISESEHRGNTCGSGSNTTSGTATTAAVNTSSTHATHYNAAGNANNNNNNNNNNNMYNTQNTTNTPYTLRTPMKPTSRDPFPDPLLTPQRPPNTSSIGTGTGAGSRYLYATPPPTQPNSTNFPPSHGPSTSRIPSLELDGESSSMNTVDSLPLVSGGGSNHAERNTNTHTPHTHNYNQYNANNSHYNNNNSHNNNNNTNSMNQAAMSPSSINHNLNNNNNNPQHQYHHTTIHNANQTTKVPNSPIPAHRPNATCGFGTTSAPSPETSVLLHACITLANNALAPLSEHSNHLSEHCSAWLGNLHIRKEEHVNVSILQSTARAASVEKTEPRMKVFNGSVEVGEKSLIIASRVSTALKEMEKRVEQCSLEQQNFSVANRKNKETFAAIVQAMNRLRHCDLRSVVSDTTVGVGSFACRCENDTCNSTNNNNNGVCQNRCLQPSDISASCWHVAVNGKSSCSHCSLHHTCATNIGPLGSPTARSSAANMALFNTFGAVWLGPNQPSVFENLNSTRTGLGNYNINTTTPTSVPGTNPSVLTSHSSHYTSSAMSSIIDNYVWGNPSRVKAHANNHAYIFSIDCILYGYLPKSTRKITKVFNSAHIPLDCAQKNIICIPSPTAARSFIKALYAPEEIMYYGESHAPSVTAYQAASIFDDVGTSLLSKPITYVPHALKYNSYVTKDNVLVCSGTIPSLAGLTIHSYSHTDMLHQLNTPNCHSCLVTPCVCDIPPCGPTLTAVTVDPHINSNGEANTCMLNLAKAEILQVNLTKMHNLAYDFYNFTTTNVPSSLPPLPSVEGEQTLTYPLSHDGKHPLKLPVMNADDISYNLPHPRESDPELHNIAYRLRFPCPVPTTLPITTPLMAPHLFGLLAKPNQPTSNDKCKCVQHNMNEQACPPSCNCECNNITLPPIRIPVLGATHINKFPNYIRISANDSESLLPPPIDTLKLCEMLRLMDNINLSLLLSALLCETKILIVSKTAYRVTAIMDTLLSLLYPFKWQSLLIPLLHHGAGEILYHKRPYIIGAQSCTLELIAKQQIHQKSLNTNLSSSQQRKEKVEQSGLSGHSLNICLTTQLELGSDVVIYDADTNVLKYTAGCFVAIPESSRRNISKAVRSATSSLFLAALSKNLSGPNSSSSPNLNVNNTNVHSHTLPSTLNPSHQRGSSATYDDDDDDGPHDDQKDVVMTGNMYMTDVSGSNNNMILNRLINDPQKLLACAYPTGADPVRPTILAVTSFRNSILDVMLDLFYKYALFWDACVTSYPPRPGIHNACDAPEPYSSVTCMKEPASSGTHGYYGVAKPARENILTGPYTTTLPQPKVTIHSPHDWYKNVDYDLRGFINHSDLEARSFLTAVCNTNLFRYFIVVRHRLRGMPVCMYLFDQWAILRIHQRWTCQLSVWKTESLSAAVNVSRSGGNVHRRLCELHGSRIHLYHNVIKTPSLPMPKHDRLLVPLCVKLIMPVVEKANKNNSSFGLKLVACLDPRVRYWLHSLSSMVAGFNAMSLTTLRTHFKILLERNTPVLLSDLHEFTKVYVNMSKVPMRDANDTSNIHEFSITHTNNNNTNTNTLHIPNSTTPITGGHNNTSGGITSVNNNNVNSSNNNNQGNSLNTNTNNNSGSGNNNPNTGNANSVSGTNTNNTNMSSGAGANASTTGPPSTTITNGNSGMNPNTNNNTNNNNTGTNANTNANNAPNTSSSSSSSSSSGSGEPTSVIHANPIYRVEGNTSKYPNAVLLLDGTEETRVALSSSANPPAPQVSAFGPSNVCIRQHKGKDEKHLYSLHCVSQQDVPRLIDKYQYLPMFWYALDTLKTITMCPSNAYNVDYITSLTEPDLKKPRGKVSASILETQKQHLNQYEVGCREVPWPLSLLLICETLKTWERGLNIKCDNLASQTQLTQMLNAKLQDPEIILRYQQFL